MKKRNYILLAAMTALVFSSCSKDFLQKEPPLEMSTGDIFSTYDRIESSLLGVYSEFKNNSYNSFIGGKSYLAIDAKGEDFVNISSNLVTLSGTYNMQTGATDDENTVTWQSAYLAINNANTFLLNLESAKTVAGDSYDQFKSEALFVRALSYYYLTTFYAMPYKLDHTAKAVPLRLTASTDGSGNSLKRSTIEEVLNQILTDLSDANIASLPSVSNTYDAATRATQGAAHALRMRIYMEMENWDAAIAEANAITGYSLAADVASLYSAPYYSAETIFSLPMADNNRPNTQQTVWEYYYDGQIMVLDNNVGIYGKTGYNLTTDKRISSLIGTANSRKISTKFTSKNSWIPIFRYAEIKLNLAECYAAKGGAANETLAKNLLKEVRRRSLASADDSLLPDATLSALTGVDLKNAIYNERRLEFLGEGIRSLDIRRRAETFRKGTDANPIIVSPSDDNYIWPIPTSETSINKAIND
jgi:uncharacterized protein YxjI